MMTFGSLEVTDCLRGSTKLLEFAECLAACLMVYDWGTHGCRSWMLSWSLGGNFPFYKSPSFR